MNRILLLLLTFSCLSASAQFEKKTVKQIEKSAKFIPLDTLLISQTQVGYTTNMDSLFGETCLTSIGGWNDYYVNLTGGQETTYEDYRGKSQKTGPFIQVKVGNHFMSAFEVSNMDYRAFVDWTKEMKPEMYTQVLLDSQGWDLPYSFNAPFIKYYHTHPAYNEYPVVNLTHEQARLYLDWLTEQYNQSSKRKYKKVRFRLPTEAEWMNAYLGGESQYTATNFGKFRNKKGQFTANFWNPSPSSIVFLQHDVFLEFSDSNLNYTKRQESIQTFPDTLVKVHISKPKMIVGPFLTSRSNDGTQGHFGVDYTTSCKSYWPNKWGIYNMAGNVAEFVAMDGIAKGGHWGTTGYFLLPNSRETFSEEMSSSPTRGFRWVMEIIEE